MKRPHELDHEIDGLEAPSNSRSFMQVLWQRKAFVLLGACLGVAMGFLWHTQQTVVYQSDAAMLIIKKSNNSPVGINLSGQSASNGADDYMGMYVAIIKSPQMLDLTFKNRKRDITSLKTFENVSNPVDLMRRSFIATRDEKTSGGTPNNIMQLAYKGAYPEDCPKILNAIIDQFQSYLKEYYASGVKETLNSILTATQTLKKELDEKEAKYAKFRKESEIWRPYNGVNVETERVAQLEKERSTLLFEQIRLKEQILNLEKAIENKQGDEAVAAIRENSTNAQVRQQQEINKNIEEPLTPLIAKLNEYQQDYGPAHPEIIRLEARIKLTRERLKEIAPKVTEKDPADRYLTFMKIRLQDAESQLKSLDESLTTMKQAARIVNNLEIDERHLVNDIRRTEALFDLTMQRLTASNVTKDAAPEAGSIETNMLSLPGVGQRVAPIFYRDLAAGLMLGLLIGVGLGYVADISDKSFRSPEEVRKQLGLPLVGHIPFFKPDPDLTKRREMGEATVDPMLCCYFKPKSLDSEAYRAVRTALFFSTQGQGLKVIQVTSPNKGDGKSLMISNLAVTTAQSGKKVLLIDADCRRPRQHKVFNLSNSVGLTSILNNSVAPEDTIQESCVPGLSIISSGPIPHNPSELLVQPRFKELLDGFRPDYDYIFVDTPPLLAVTDPCVVAGIVDGLFLTIRLTRKGRPDAERAREILQSLHVKVFGIVVNGVTRLNAGLYSSQAYDYTDTYVDYENEGKEYYYADDDDSGEDVNKELARLEG